eukprot:TRINITY_DN424_c0_g1_i6.p1 TRINITY_DN424_c0_g1~~TRINITY_DN424_c0_g1_i6.p1  ORF type:complete len:126 (+),score=39.17 TRINITY_DN424_c0_g1_i6:3-380(+)
MCIRDRVSTQSTWGIKIYLIQNIRMASLFKRLSPTLNRVLIKRIEAQSKTPSGIILQEADKSNIFGEVVEVGPGNYDTNGKLIPVNLKKGDSVLLPEYGGTKIKLQENEYFLYRDNDILAVLHKD